MIKTFNLPINSVSFGQVSTSILKFFFDKKEKIALFPIGNNIDVDTQTYASQEFKEWLNLCATEAYLGHDRNNNIFKLWHLNGGLESYSKNQTLFSFYELDSPTKVELNVAKNSKALLFSSEYAVDNFKKFGLDNVFYVPLFFDKYNFKRIDKKYFGDDRIVFNLVGKLERRKHHLKLLKAWAKKFGNNSKYFLQCSIFNQFLKPEDQTKIIASAMDGKMYFNIQFLNFMPNNLMYNDYLNSADIIIGMSGGEGWGLPEFHSVALGKHAVILNAHGYKSWANKTNSTLVEPSSKIDSVDGIFFHKNSPYNQGNIFDFNEDDFISACEETVEKVKANRVNSKGIELQEAYSIDKFISNIYNYV
ncbi:glycosyltransferase family 1 protein [bacterium]|nr:glycosyltransferase family 1 protein [Candidatus Elulimicrobium humile]